MKKGSLLFLILFISLFSTLSLSAREKKPDNVSMVIGYIPHVQFTPLYVGMEKKIFEKHGIKLKIEYGFGIDAFSLILNNKVDCTLSDADQLLIARDKGLPLKSFLQYYQSYPVSIVTEGENVKPSELAGKRLGVPQLFGTSYIGTLMFLNRYNLKDKVELVKIGYTQMASLTGKKVDAVTCFYNNEPIQLRKRGTLITEWMVKDFSNLVGASFITSDSKLKRDRKKMKNFIKALEESIEWTVKNQSEALEISYKYVDTLQEEEKDFWREVLSKTCELFQSPAGYGAMDKKRYEETIETMHSLGLIKKKLSVNDAIYK